MAKKSSAGQSSAPTQPTAAPISKQEAVRQALAALGRDAKPLQLQAWIREHLGIEMTADHVSTAKGIILKKRKKAARKKPGAPEAVTAPAQKVPAIEPQAPTGKQASIPLDDILTVKELVVRLGAAPLHTLIDAFAK
jgi:hypothetical protein